MTVINYLKRCGWFQLFLWPIYFAFVFTIYSSSSSGVSSFAMIYACLGLIFIVNSGLAISFPILTKVPVKWQYALSAPILILVFILLIYFVVFICYPYFSSSEFGTIRSSSSWELFGRIVEKSIGIFFIVGSIAGSIFSKYKSELVIEEQERTHQKELDRLDMEFRYLSLQINPHFFYNALEHVRSGSWELSPELSDWLRVFGSIFYYKLQTAGMGAKTVSLDRELEALRNYLIIERSRFPDSNIDFEVIGELEGERIMPGVLINILENVFTHGLYIGKDNPVVARLVLRGDSILFTCSNKIKSRREIRKSTGFGIANTRKRLEIMFPNKHRFEASRTEDSRFYVELEIDLS